MAFVNHKHSEPPRTAQDRPANAIVATCAGAGAEVKTMAKQTYMAEVSAKGFGSVHGFVAEAVDVADVRRQIAAWYPKSWRVQVLSISEPMTKEACIAIMRRQLDAAKVRVAAMVKAVS